MLVYSPRYARWTNESCPGGTHVESGNEVWSARHRRDAYDTLPSRRWASGVREGRGGIFQAHKRSGTRRLDSPYSQSFPQSSSFSSSSSYSESVKRRGQYKYDPPNTVTGLSSSPHVGISLSERKRSNRWKKEAGVDWNAQKPRTRLSVISLTHSTRRPKSPSVCHHEAS
jgi:hypothetical protein